MCRQKQLPPPQEDAGCWMSQPDAKTPVPDASPQRLLYRCLCQVHLVASPILLRLKATPLLCEPCLPACLPRRKPHLQGLIVCVTPREQRGGLAHHLMTQEVQKSLPAAASAILGIAWQVSGALARTASLITARLYTWELCRAPPDKSHSTRLSLSGDCSAPPCSPASNRSCGLFSV